MKWNQWEMTDMARVVGNLLLFGGILLSLWIYLDWPEGFPNDFAVRRFMDSVLNYMFVGFVIILIADVATRMGSRITSDDQNLPEAGYEDNPGSEPARVTSQAPLLPLGTAWRAWNSVNTPQLGRAAGVLILLGGGATSIWEAVVYDDDAPLTIGAAQYFLTSFLNYVFQAFVIIGLAELADRIPWGSAGVEDEAEEIV